MQKILMNYYEYDKERHIIMVDVYLLPANEGDCLWVRYGKKEGTRHNIIIDGGVESNGGDIASIIENIAERNEKVDIFVTHIDGDHIRGLIKGIGISNAEVLKKCVDTIYFNNKKDILDKFRIDSISSEGLEESIKTYIPSGKGYSISEAVSLLEILKKKEIDDKIDGCVFAGRNICIAGASLKIVSPSDKELIQFVTKCTKKVDEDGAVTKGYSANMPQNLNIDLKDLMNEKFPPADSSITNRVSIGFIFEYDDAKIAFWGDAVAPVICRGLKRFGINSEFEVDAVKTSHHGSSRNISKFPLVSFALNINMQFDENYEVLIRNNTDINNKLSHLKNELEPLTEFKVLNINVLENELENITQTVAKMELTVSDFTIYKNYTENEFLEMGDKYNAEKVELGIRIELLCQISEENTARFYFTNYKQNKRAMWNAERRSEKLQIEKENKIVELDKIQKNLEKELSLYFSKSTMNEIYQKIDPHDVMKRLEYHLSFNDAQKGELFITLSESESDSDSDYRPEIYFSTAQLNTVAFSSFFSRALDRKNNLPIQTIFIDDPIGHFDDMNILGFADLMRSLIDNSNWQIVISTHDEKIFRILQRKLSGEYYSSCFLKLPSGKGIKWIE